MSSLQFCLAFGEKVLRLHSPDWKLWGPPVQALHPTLLALWERKGALKAEDIQTLGKEAEEAVDHPLSKLVEYLKKSEIAEQMAGNWERKYSNLGTTFL